MNKILNFFKNKKKIDFIDCVLGLCATFSVSVAIYYIFVYGSAFMHSDAAITERYAQSVLETKSIFPATWNFANGEIYSFRVIPFAIVLSMIFTNQVFARVLASSIMLLIVCATIIIYVRKSLLDNSWLLIISLFLVFLGGAEARNMLLYEGVYQLEMTGIVLGCLWIFRCNKSNSVKENRAALVGIAIMFFLMGLQGKRHWAEFIIPFAITVYMFNLYVIREESTVKILSSVRNSIKTTLIFIVPAVVGYLTYKVVASTHLMNYGKGEVLIFPDSFKMLTKQFKSIIILFFETFGFDSGVNAFSLLGIRNLVSIFICIIICFVVPVLQLRKLHEEKDEIKFLYIFGIVHNLLMLIIDVCFAKDSQRYLLSCIYICILISGRYIYVYWLKQKMLDKYIWITLFVFAACIEGLSMLKQTVGVEKYYESNKRVCNILEEHGLTKGYGTIWNSYVYELYSNGNIRFGAINASDTGFDAYLALNDSSLYRDDGIKTFVILSKEELDDVYGYDLGYLDTPIDEFVIEDVYLYDINTIDYEESALHVFVYNYDVASRIKNGFSDGVLSVKDMEFNWQGTKDWENFYVNKDGMVFGPYSVIEPGTYLVTYEGANMTDLYCDVWSEKEMSQNNITYSFVEKERMDSKVVLLVTIKDTIRDIQFRAINKGDEQIVLKDILVEKCK